MAENELRRHKIRAELYDNVLTEDPNDFAARVIADKPLNTRDVCNYAAQRGGADVSAKAMNHAVDLFLDELVYLACNGFTVSTGVFNLRPKIKIEGESAENGVYFINQETNERVKVSSKIPVNKPSELMVVIPALAAGSYKLELVTQYGGNSKHLLKEPRNTVFDRVLSVL